MKKQIDLRPEQIDRIIEMAWEDRTPFDAIQMQFGAQRRRSYSNDALREMKSSSFKMWRASSGPKNRAPQTAGNQSRPFSNASRSKRNRS